MEQYEKSYYISRIVSGQFRYYIDNKEFVIRNVSLENQYLAEELFRSILDGGIKDGLMSEDDVLNFLIDQGIWTVEQQESFSKIEKDIEEFKVQIFKSKFRSDERKLLKFNLAHFRNLHSELYSVRHSYDHLSAMGLAQTARYKYLTACSIYYKNGKPLWSKPSSNYRANKYNYIIDETLSSLSKNRISESTFRELARTDPWRSIWGCRESAGLGLFGKAASELTEEQRVLSLWSLTYDNIFNSPEKPDAKTVEDDDALDGWIILQQRKSKVEEKERFKIDNEKIANSDEVFIIADNIEDAREIEELNSDMGKMLKRQKMNMVQTRGTVNEADFPEVQQKFALAVNQFMTRHGGH